MSNSLPAAAAASTPTSSLPARRQTAAFRSTAEERLLAEQEIPRA
ncbi:hypothetical protein APTSU1_001343500 [Apodemus speciosus]|uniref:Uncharacterized protein n=1 Tax=Apodemus speciosus TaxID=105296 RepID=A0ABQ0FG32_APOSI